MKTLFLTAVLTLSFSNLSQAMNLEDPNSIMDEVSFFKEGRSFKTEFKLGDEITTETNICWGEQDDSNDDPEYGCDSETKVMRVTTVTPNAAIMNTHYAISKDTYIGLDRNPLNLLIDMNEFQSALSSQNMISGSTTMRLDSYTQGFSGKLGVNTMKIKFTLIYSGDDYTFESPMYVVLAQGLPFVGQIAEFSFDKDLSDNPTEWKTMYQVIDWVKFL
jgi:hypothetical protein